MASILDLLRLTPSSESIDYVENKKQFHLFSLLTEQRHAKTWNLSFAIRQDVDVGIRMLMSVDSDISRTIGDLIRSQQPLERAASAVATALESGRKIYVYGCGATGRLAKQMESDLWRPFWRRARNLPCWSKLSGTIPNDVEELLVGEMTGADRALVSSLEGFEDLQLIGRLQLEDRQVRRGDVVFCVTEGGETSSVIGTILAAVEQYGVMNAGAASEAREHLFFIYNNPDELLACFDRCAAVLDNPAITRINLTTGPQAITGSTRMQATTIETFIIGTILEEGIARFLRKHLNDDDMHALGYTEALSLSQRLAAFDAIKASVDASIPDIANFTALEASTYSKGRFATYFARKAMITVFIDSTERSPTFRLNPLDTAEGAARKCWVQVWTEAENSREAWMNLLGRPFRGLEDSFYRRAFEQLVTDPYLRSAALRSLANAGNDQEFSYDFSFSRSNIERRGPKDGDLGVLVAVDEEIQDLERAGSCFIRFQSLLRERNAFVCLVCVTGADSRDQIERIRNSVNAGDVLVPVYLDNREDPLNLHRQIALKMLLNAHSTGVMARLGRVIGNTMTSVSPSNLKLIGRATYLVMSHVNDVLDSQQMSRGSGSKRITFAEANAVLMDAIDYVRSAGSEQTAEVALAIIRILESFTREGGVSWEETRQILDQEGLASYLVRRNPALGLIAHTGP